MAAIPKKQNHYFIWQMSWQRWDVNGSYFFFFTSLSYRLNCCFIHPLNFSLFRVEEELKKPLALAMKCLQSSPVVTEPPLLNKCNPDDWESSQTSDHFGYFFLFFFNCNLAFCFWGLAVVALSEIVVMNSHHWHENMLVYIRERILDETCAHSFTSF